MAVFYVRSTDGSDADNGSTWALAKATLGGALTACAAGDTIYVSHQHSESTAASTLSQKGTKASPVKIICVNDGAEPPTTLATSAAVAITGSSVSWKMPGCLYVYGITFTANMIGNSNMMFGNDATGLMYQKFENCDFVNTLSSSYGSIYWGSANSTNPGYAFEFVNCNFKLAGDNYLVFNRANVCIRGGSILSGHYSLATSIFHVAGSASTSLAGASFLCEGFDFTNAPVGANLLYFCGPGMHAVFRNCKLRGSWSGSPGGTKYGGGRVEMHNCSNANVNYSFYIDDYLGTVKEDTSVYCTGGASNGTTSMSMKMVSGADAEYPLMVLYSPEFVRWQEGVGSQITVTVEINSSATLNDNDVWLEVTYLGTSGYPVSALITDRVGLLTTAAAQDSSAAAWNGGTTAQKLVVQFTPQVKGFLHARVALAKASTTVYVDPVMTVS